MQSYVRMWVGAVAMYVGTSVGLNVQVYVSGI
jgi:hypothetical protein